MKKENGKARVQHSHKGKLWKLVFLIAVIVIAYLALKDSWGNIWEELSQTSWKVLVLVFLCSILYNCFDGLAVTKLMRSCDSQFPWWEGILCSYYYSFFRVITFGSGTAAAGMYYVSWYKVPLSRSFGIFTINYMIQRMAVCLYFVIGFLAHYGVMEKYFAGYRSYMILGVVMAVMIVTALVSICISAPLHNLAFALAEKVIRNQQQHNKIQGWKEKSATLRGEAHRLLKNKKLLFGILGLNFLKLTSWYLIPVIIFYKMEIPEWTLLVSVAAMVYALSGVIPAPGGVGAVEFVFVLLFTPLVGNVAAASGMFIYRFSTYLLPFFLGIIVVLRQRRRKIKAGKTNQYN